MKHRAVTLVELLVVVGIIATLAALVFGVLGPAREKSRESVCTSNLRQIGMMIQMYRSDWEGKEPVVGVRTTYSDVGLPPQPWSLPRYKETRDAGLWRCPSAKVVLPKWFDQKVCCYAMPGFADGLPEMTDAITKHGSHVIVMSCDQHNADIHYSRQPSWSTKRVLILRLDQSLTWRTFPVRDTTSMFDW